MSFKAFKEGYAYFAAREDYDSLLGNSPPRTATVFFRWKLPP